MSGTKPDGTKKIRPIDDMSRSKCNAATTPTEKFEYENLDVFLQVIKTIKKKSGSEFILWKASTYLYTCVPSACLFSVHCTG